MIFRTITDDITGANKSIGLFGRSFNDFKGIINSYKEHGFISTLLNTPLINIDTDAIDTYNYKIKSGIPYEKALADARETTNASTLALIEASHGAEVRTERVTAAQKASTLAAKAQAAALKLSSIALNAAAMVVISKAISFAATTIDNHIHRVDNAKEALADSVSAFEQTKSEIEKLNDELKTCGDRIVELRI